MPRKEIIIEGSCFENKQERKAKKKKNVCVLSEGRVGCVVYWKCRPPVQVVARCRVQDDTTENMDDH